MDARTSVIINGEMITLTSNESPIYLQQLAHYVTQKTDEVMAQYAGMPVNEKMRGRLVALNIADELFKVQPALDKLQLEHEKFIRELGRMQEENAMLAEAVGNLQREMARDKTIKLPFHDTRKAAQ